MTRVPVELAWGWTPPGTTAWVPRRRTIILHRDAIPTPGLIAHELAHVCQRERLGAWFLPTYLWQWVRAGFRYDAILMEREARDGAKTPSFLAWARDVLSERRPYA